MVKRDNNDSPSFALLSDIFSDKLKRKNSFRYWFAVTEFYRQTLSNNPPSVNKEPNPNEIFEII